MGRVKEILEDMALLVSNDFNIVKGDVIKVVIDVPNKRRPGAIKPKKGASVMFKVVNSTDNSARIVPLK